MKNRRDFLKNTALSALGVAVIKRETTTGNSASQKDLLACEQTTLDYFGEGPFYTDQPPLIENNLMVDDTEVGQRLIVSGRVFNLDCSQYIPNTIVDIWHANSAGQYDNVGYKLRGYTKTNAQGFYLFETILPGKYLNGSQFRPSHIHFKIKPPEFPLITTQLYFEGDASIANDRAASITSGQFDASNRIISLTENTDGKLEGQFDIVVEGAGIGVATRDLHLNTGMIYAINPNPMQDSLLIKYGVFKKAKVGIVVYDMEGRSVATLQDRVMTPEKYEVTWQPETGLSNGHYFVAIKINDLQVHYQKVLKN